MEDWALARLNTQQIDLSSQSQAEAYGQLTRNELASICSQLNCDAAFIVFHHPNDYQAFGGILPHDVRWIDEKPPQPTINTRQVKPKQGIEANSAVNQVINSAIDGLISDDNYLESVFAAKDAKFATEMLPQRALNALKVLTEHSLMMSRPCNVGDTWLVLGVITHKPLALVLDKHAYHLASSLELQALSFSIAKKDRQYQELFQQLPIPCALIDSDNRVMGLNHIAKNSLSLELTASVFTLLDVDDHAMLHDTLHIVREGLLRQAWCEVPLLLSGQRHWFKLSFCHALDDKAQLLMLAEDITERYRLADELSFHSNHDVLTGLPNRVQFELLLDEALKDPDSANACVAFLDLDQFQVINDVSGHQAGDELLCQVAKRLKLLLRKGDVVARLGGDEFGILMYSATQESATLVAKRICLQLSEHEFQWRKVKHNVSVSMGLAKLDKNAGDIYTVLSQIDASCRLAKEEGRNQWHFYSKDDPQISKLYNQMLASVDITGALALDEFELFYQLIEPLEKADTGLHMEVLLRMVQKDGSYVSPAIFLPAAERYNLASRIDRWVIDNLLKWGANNLATWQQLTMVSINLSALSLGDQKFMSWLEMRLMVEPELVDKLCFEITETAAVSQLDQATALIDLLQPLGCKLALDDFGSGFSSFAYLKCLDVDFVKIDGQFVVNLCQDKSDKAIVAAICQLGKDMEFEVIAEFVESVEVGYLLKNLGVDYAQGYAIAKPQRLSSLTSGLRTPWLVSEASFYSGADI
ncbi:diguanylate cyclase/phosphodiesterase [Shewanella denitrificans OS217]|uniref:Diguanylate cyclase/phosphodiesterase n=1 Tax=Shewanella denitrificans (strain OS217 / ATCC BAA-1090 / DSM 15013) TaxID=318161 RepID=Q12JD4_SHEDO|nr:EAL domain-containing protein [Shewanella denitrificans]ABE56442.1 diguanylate cyclase/phosphodiesterase [Shewanella denitrificans OS217]